jgi:NAD(P)-dependent dehydrogenase (short-subunit alcohol dehydrogenase family)
MYYRHGFAISLRAFNKHPTVTSVVAQYPPSKLPTAEHRTGMKQKSVLITGCSSGIGKCLAHGLRNRGYRIFATARQQADVDELAADGFESLRLDLDSSESIRYTVNEVLQRTDSKLYALINNGAYGQPGAVEDLSRETLRAQFETSAQCPRRTGDSLPRRSSFEGRTPGRHTRRRSLSRLAATAERAAPRAVAAPSAMGARSRSEPGFLERSCRRLRKSCASGSGG